MTLRFDANGKPVGLDWSVCNDGTDRPEVWKTWRAPKPKTVEEEGEERAATHSRQRIAPALEARIIRMYRDEGRSARECAEAAGVKPPTVFKVLKRNGIESRGYTSNVRSLPPETVAEIVRLYVDELQSSGQICKRLGVANRTVTRTLVEQGVTMRSASESAKLDRARRAGRL